MVMVMNLGHLAVFHAVAEAKSVSGGAESLLISQPAVSKQVRLLEQSLGATLFERTPRGVTLTEAARYWPDMQADFLPRSRGG